MFSFYMPENSDPSDYRDPVFFRMKQMVNEAAHNGITLLHENKKVSETLFYLIQCVVKPLASAMGI